MSALRIALCALALALGGCASGQVKRSVDEVGLLAPGHLEWWNDSAPRVLELPRVCDGIRPEFLVPGPVPAVHLRLDPDSGLAVFHDGPPACAEGARSGPPLRLVVAADPVPLEGADSALLMGRMEPVETDEDSDPWYSMGKTPESDGRYDRNACREGARCLRPGAVLRWRSAGDVRDLEVRELLHPERSPWGLWQRRLRASGYLVAVPVDIVLSPLYLVGGAVLYFLLRDFHPWR